MKESLTLGSVMVDCKNADEMQAFYAELLGWEKTELFSFPAVRSGEGIVFAFLEEPDFVPPVWPEEPEAQQKQMHFDFQVEDVHKAAARAETLGAVRAKAQYGGDDWVTLFDPAGHPFCLCKKSTY